MGYENLAILPSMHFSISSLRPHSHASRTEPALQVSSGAYLQYHIGLFHFRYRAIPYQIKKIKSKFCIVPLKALHQCPHLYQIAFLQSEPPRLTVSPCFIVCLSLVHAVFLTACW